jgi:hypothetical protein
MPAYYNIYYHYDTLLRIIKIFYHFFLRIKNIMSIFAP